MTLSQGQRHLNWYRMLEANGAHKQGLYEKIGLNSLHVMFNVNVFAMQEGWQAGRPDEHN